MLSDIRRLFFTTLLLVAVVLPAAPASWAGDDLSGLYAMDGHRHGGEPYTGELAVKGRGHAFDASWRRGGGTAENGFGLLLNHVLGVAYWPGDEALDPGLGVVIYRIDGGTLDGRRAFMIARPGAKCSAALRTSPGVTRSRSGAIPGAGTTPDTSISRGPATA